MNDDPAQVPISKFLEAHARPNGSIHPWHDFFHSNLFTALVIFLLTQSVVVASLLITLWIRAATLAEWKGGVDATLKRMDEQGTNHSHWLDQEQQKQIDADSLRIGKMEGDTSHLDVLEREHARLTTDVEKLKDWKEGTGVYERKKP